MKRIILSLCTIIWALCLFSCRSSHSITETENKEHRDEYRGHYEKDSVFIDRWHDVFRDGDTIRIRDSIMVDRWHLLHDTLRLNDTVKIKDKQKEIVTKEVKVYVWWPAIASCSAFVVILLVLMLKKRSKIGQFL